MFSAKKYIRDLTPYQTNKPLTVVAADNNVPNDSIIQLASNENPYGASPEVYNSLQHAMHNSHRYPDQHELIGALAEHLGVTENMVVLGNGSNDILDLVARVFLGEGDEAISSEYSFAVYKIATQTSGANNVIVPAPDYTIDLEAMLAAITQQTKVIWIDNPGNPTGTFLPYDEIKHFLERVPQSIVVVLDEAYYEYLDPEQRVDTPTWLEKYPNLFIVRTFSKIYGLAGLRIGYGIAHPEVVEFLNRARQPFNTNSLAILAAVSALKDQDFVELSYRRNKQEKGILVEALQKANQLRVLPAYGNFVTVGIYNTEVMYKKLLENGVVVRPLAAYNMPQYLRISIGTDEENAKLTHLILKENGDTLMMSEGGEHGEDH